MVTGGHDSGDDLYLDVKNELFIFTGSIFAFVNLKPFSIQENGKDCLLVQYAYLC